MADMSPGSSRSDEPKSEPRTRPSLLLRVRVWSDLQAWNEFVKWCLPVVRDECRRHGLREAETEEIVQRVLIRLARTIERFAYDPSKSFRGWLRTLTRSTILNFWERDQDAQAAGTKMMAVDPTQWAWPVVDPQSLDEDQGDERDVPHSWRVLRDRIARAQALARERFGRDTWEAFWLVQIEGRSPAEAALALGKTPGAVRAARARVLAMLRQIWDEMDDSGDEQ
ncbi:sigma-70 family RNA polymerase sigma factor [Tautonia marina]|uniref:sigma-70 family RNA polymerase sigma factor n=1 Tax=Tautonia marina TaxID=2653855 RepID=UPI0013757CC6|nr:sigma-70 family RNA polymerase sigma factor [Tautonia marina]